MADVFISYAKTDRPLALKLAAMLEAEGWKTWWDTGLIPGDDFRNEIMTELGRARAVIVIWTDASIKSDWVRSEAGRAQADRKLIPVKLPHLVYKDLPPPFDVLHTENVGEEDKIRAAVVAQLAKPAVEPTAVALLTKGFKYEVLTWLGIIGGALTLFTNIGATLQLARWARLLVQGWREWTHAFWLWAIGLHMPPELTAILSFLLFWSLLTIGQAVKFHSTIKKQTIVDEYQGKSFQLISWRALFCIVLILVSTAFWLPWGYYIVADLAVTILPPVIVLSPIAMFTVPQVIILVLCARYKLHAAVAACLMAVFLTIITLNSLTYVTPVMFPIISIPPVILLSVAPAKAVSRRLIFLALGLLLLIALNELSKLGLDVTAPKLQG